MGNKNELTKNSIGDVPPTFAELQTQVHNIEKGLLLWRHTITAGFPSERDKIEFYATMENFLQLLPSLSHAYYGIVSELEQSIKFKEAIFTNSLHPEAGKGTAQFVDFANAVLRLPDAKKKWRKLKKAIF